MKPGHHLADIDGFPEAIVATLAGYSISTAEELLALDQVTDDLCEVLKVEPSDLDHAVSAAADAVGSDHASTLEAIRDAPTRGTGAISPTSDAYDAHRSRSGWT